VDDSATGAENGFLDLHGREVHAFGMEMANVGFQRMADLLTAMLKSGSWRSFKDGLGSYSFLPGEFDYFLIQRGIRREDVMKLPDIDVKAVLEEHMDERRTGEEDYRRPVLQARAQNPQIPGRPIEPFGYTESEAKSLVNGTRARRAGGHREPLGASVRRFRNTGTARAPNKSLPDVERLRRSAIRLDDDDLAGLIDSLKQEQRRRRGR
jgi:hypothetical protein